VLLLQKVITPEQLQALVSTQLFGNATLIKSNQISVAPNNENSKDVKLESSSYENFQSERPPEAVQNSANSTLIEPTPISVEQPKNQPISITPKTSSETLIEQPSISEVKPSRSAGMVSRLAALGMKP
jgi:hypothetical protein